MKNKHSKCPICKKGKLKILTANYYYKILQCDNKKCNWDTTKGILVND